MIGVVVFDGSIIKIIKSTITRNAAIAQPQADALESHIMLLISMITTDCN